MNITFENGRADNEVRSKASSNVRSHADREEAFPVRSQIFALDISGTAMDNTAYDDHGKTIEDVMQNAGQIDAATQKNYMVVMSNTMSDEDFARLQEEGYHPGNTEIETVVTIVDQIKAALAKGGSNITGYTDDLDVETLKQITGSLGLAEEIAKQFSKHDIPVTKENVEDVLKTCGMVTRLDDLSDGVIKYMVGNGLEPTVDNIYLSQYSAAADADKQGRGYYQDDTGYYAKKAEEYNWKQLEPQMGKVIGNAGLELSKETLDDAKWLVEKGLPLTEKNLNALYELRHLKIPDTMEGIVSAAAAAVANGKNAGEANIADDRTDLEKAAGLLGDVNSISDEAADMAAAEGRRLNIRNLKAAQIQISIGIRAETYSVNTGARRLMEEVRLQMTVEANIHLIRSGFSIDTADLERLVGALRQSEQQVQEMMFGKTEMSGNGIKASDLFLNSVSTVRELGSMPAALIGRFAYREASFTLEAAYAEGNALRTAYIKAGESYETLMTAPRPDLGDTIKKAFRNVDDLLLDMKLDTSGLNRRAVRILGYNRMEVSKENIEAVKTLDLSIERVLDKMKPASTLQMIREGINPLSMDMGELEAYLDSQEKSPKQQIEKYGEFLYKLQRNQSVTEEERDAYIGIYRLFRQLQKTDGAAIGTLIGQGIQPTVENLLTAMRSNKKHGMDVTVDDSFGGLTAVYSGKSISGQIGEISRKDSRPAGKEAEYYTRLAKDIFDHLDGGILNTAPPDQDMNLEQLAQILRNAKTDEAVHREYTRRQAGEIRKSLSAEESVIKELLDYNQPVTADNLLAAGLLMKERGKAAGRLYELAVETDREDTLKEAVDNLHESMADAESAKEAYEKLEQTYTELLDELAYGQKASGQIDIKEIASLCKQISLSGNLAREENYEVPVQIGEEVTSINLKIIHGQEENGKVTAAMDSVIYGKVSAYFDVSEGMDGKYRMTGYIAGDSISAVNKLKQSQEVLKNSLEQTDIKLTGLHIIHNERLDFTVRAPEPAAPSADTPEIMDKQRVSTRKLYEAAKVFIGYIQKG